MLVLTPMNNRVQIEKIAAEEQKSGIIIHVTQQEEIKAKVVAVGADGDVKDFVKVGDTIVYRPNSLEIFLVNGETLYFVPRHNIVGVLPAVEAAPIQ
jgi:co-chaperonin GroES (HSP10)